MAITFTEISETFELLDDWEEKYRYVIELGRDYDCLLYTSPSPRDVE